MPRVVAWATKGVLLPGVRRIAAERKFRAGALWVTGPFVGCPSLPDVGRIGGKGVSEGQVIVVAPLSCRLSTVAAPQCRCVFPATVGNQVDSELPQDHLQAAELIGMGMGRDHHVDCLDILVFEVGR